MMQGVGEIIGIIANQNIVFLVKELFSISSSSEQHAEKQANRLLVLLADRHFSMVYYHPEEKAVKKWEMSELPAESLSPGEDLAAYLETQTSQFNGVQVADVLVMSGRQTIVPLSVYRETQLAAFASLQFPSGKEDLLLCDKDTLSGTAVIYSLDRPLHHVLNASFPDARFTHLFHHVIKQNATDIPQVGLSILPSQFILTIQDKGKWQLLQSYAYQTGEDVLYVLLNALEQIGIEPNEAQVLVNGLVDRKSSLAQLLEQYIYQIEWGGDLKFSYPETEGFDRHAFSFIDSILSCVS
jgi:hypothetical protein